MVDLVMVDVLAAAKNVAAVQGGVEPLVRLLKSCGDYLWRSSLAGGFSCLGTKDR